MFENVGDAGYLVQLVVAFGAGVISFVSPCVLPLVPGYLSMMSGYTAAQIESGEASTRRLVTVIVEFILGFTLVFTALGAAATSVGQFLRSNLGTLTRVAGAVIVVFGVIMVVMALSSGGPLAMMGQEKRVQVRPSRLGRWAPPVMGAAFAFGWTPCIGPVLTVILATAAAQETVLRGVFLLIAYSLGLGVPFLLAGLGLFKWFTRLRPHLRGIAVTGGILLALFGVVMLTNNLGTVSTWIVNGFEAGPWLRDLASV